MKEALYKIPLIDAFKTDCECPFCVIERDLENKALDFVVGSVFDDSGDVDAKENLFEEDELDLDWKESNIDMWQWDYSNS